mgnify:CR=1 FL=1
MASAQGALDQVRALARVQPGQAMSPGNVAAIQAAEAIGVRAFKLSGDDVELPPSAWNAMEYRPGMMQFNAGAGATVPGAVNVEHRTTLTVFKKKPKRVGGAINAAGTASSVAAEPSAVVVAVPSSL